VFTVFCPGHDADVLIWSGSIERIVNERPGVLRVHYRCPCGARGAIRAGRHLNHA
jgi:hypothetical protein